jgi:hypothetical protein
VRARSRCETFLKNENERPAPKSIRLAFAQTPDGPCSAPTTEPITGDFWAEGPTVLTVDGQRLDKAWHEGIFAGIPEQRQNS